MEIIGERASASAGGGKADRVSAQARQRGNAVPLPRPNAPLSPAPATAPAAPAGCSCWLLLLLAAPPAALPAAPAPHTPRHHAPTPPPAQRPLPAAPPTPFLSLTSKLGVITGICCVDTIAARHKTRLSQDLWPHVLPQDQPLDPQADLRPHVLARDQLRCLPPPLPTPAGSPSPPTQQPLVFSSPGSPSHPLVFSLLGSRRSPHATSASPWASTYAHPARAAEKGKKHHRQIAPAISLCRSLPLVRPPRTHAHENRSDSPLPRLLPCPSLLDHGLRIYTPQVPAQPPAAPIRLARERHSPLALISNCPSTRRARRYICHSAAASTPGAPTPIETDYPLEFSEDTTYWRTTPRRCPPATTGPPWTALSWAARAARSVGD